MRFRRNKNQAAKKANEWKKNGLSEKQHGIKLISWEDRADFFARCRVN